MRLREAFAVLALTASAAHADTLSVVICAYTEARWSDLSAAIESWLESQATRPEHVPAAAWLRFEQEKHQRLLEAALS